MDNNISVYIVMFLLSIVISVLWARGIDNNIDVKSDDVEWP